MDQQRDFDTALAADALTAARMILAVPILVSVARSNLPLASILLVAAWWTDFFDGRFARRSQGATRLAAWDPVADATIAVALLGGLIAAGTESPAPWGVLGGVLLIAFLVRGNIAWGMLLQALAYELFLTHLLRDDAGWLVLPGLTVAIMLIANRRRFFGELLPAFFAGVGADRLASAQAWERWR